MTAKPTSDQSNPPMNDESLAGKRDRSYVPWYRRCVPSRRTVAIALLVLIALPFCIRWYRLSLLPDVPLPFDVDEFGLSDLPVEDNAYYFFGQIQAPRVPSEPWYDGFTGKYYASARSGSRFVWTELPEEVRLGMTQAQSQIELFRAAGRCADSCFIPVENYSVSTLLPIIQQLRNVQSLVVLDVLRRLDENDTPGAVELLHDAYRATRHLGRRGSLAERALGSAQHLQLLPAWHQWCRHPHVTVDELQTALDRLRSDWSRTPALSDQCRAEVVILLNESRRPINHYPGAVDDLAANFLTKLLNDQARAYGLVSNLSQYVPGWHRPVMWVMAEPELSCRAAKLWLVQELRYCDLPLSEQPPHLAGKIRVFDSPDLTAGLTAEKLNRRMTKTLIRDFFPQESLENVQRREAAWQFLLETELRVQIAFRQNRGLTPKTAEAWLAQFDWPLDPWDTLPRPIRYRIEETGLVIWSVGRNGVDDDGKLHLHPHNDIVVTIPWPK